ncbi:MAG: MFS transporter [Deltaproteobacteria bacterium]|nr:MFS transporter [Deltaproteobacteria bacterium]
MANFKQLLPIYLGAVIGPMGGIGVITLLPVLAREWNVSIQWVSLTVTLYMVPYVVFQLFSGSIAHVFNTRRTLLFGFGVYSLGGLLSGFSPSLEALVGARFVQGLGAAFIAPIVMALVGEMVNPERMGKAMGILGVMYTIGVTMGPLISGFLEVHLGWSWFFFFLMSFALAIGVLYWVTGTPGEQPAMKKSGRLGEALALVKRSYSYSAIRLLSMAAFFLFMGYIGLMTFVADYLKTSFSLPSDKIGLVLSMTGFLGVMISPIAGILGDRCGRIIVAHTGQAIMVGAILGLELVVYTYGKYILLFALFGAGAATAWTSLNTLAVQIVPDLRKPVASLYSCVKFSGYALAPLVLSLIYVPFSISGVRLACIACILISLFLTSRIRSSLL